MAKQPKEWRDGAIVLPLPSRPIKGRGHKRYRFRLDHTQADVAARKWYVRVLRDSQESQYESWDGPHLMKGFKSGIFLTPEAVDLYERHQPFWKKLADEELTRKNQATEDAKAAERSRRKQVTQEQRKAAKQMGVRDTDLRRKLARFSEMIANRDSIPLAVEVIRAADASFLSALLAGARLYISAGGKADKPSGSKFAWHPGTVFQSAGVMTKTSQEAWEFDLQSRAPNSPAWIVFWLAVTRSLLLKSLPERFRVSCLSFIAFTVRTTADAEVISEVVGVMSHLEKLEIRVGEHPFTTLAFPAMPKLKVLAFDRANDGGDDSNSPYTLTLAGLQKHALLQVISIRSAARVQVADDQVSLVNRIRFESTTLSPTNSIAAYTGEPPRLPTDITSLDRNAAQVFVSMATDYSASKSKPLWWRSKWHTLKRHADTWQPNWAEWQSGCGQVHIPRCEVLAVETARVLVASGLSLMIPARCITPPVAKVLGGARGRLCICDIEPQSVLPLDFSRLAAEALCVDIQGPVTHELASRLAAFKGSTLVIACAELSAPSAAALAAYGGQLELAEAFDGSAVAVSADTARSLSATRGRVRFMGIDDCPRGLWIISREAQEILDRAPNVSLGDYARRVFKKRTAAGLAEISLQIRSSKAAHHSHEKAALLECSITTVSKGMARSRVKNLGSVHLPGNWSRRLEKIREECEQRGFRESLSASISSGTED